MRKGVLEFIDLATKMPDIQFVWAGNFAFKGISEGRKEIMEHMMIFQITFTSLDLWSVIA